MNSHRTVRSIALAFVLAMAFARPARGDITITPKRIIFSEGSGNEQTVALVNSGNDAESYRVGLIHYSQSQQKGLTEITRPTDAPEIKWADKLLRLSPQNVVLPAKTAQTIRLQARLPANLPPGEYRTHLLLTGLPNVRPPKALEQKPGEKRPVRLSIATIYRIAIPILVWRGPLSADITFKDISFKKTKATQGEIRYSVHREGGRSVFGTVSIAFLPYKSTEPVEVARFTDLAIYHPNTDVTYTAQLELPPEMASSKGRLILTYHDANATPQIRAEDSIEVN